MVEPITPQKVSPTQWWQKVARRIRVPLGFATAAVYLAEVAQRAPHPKAIAWSVALVLPGLLLRAAASGTVKKNLDLTVTGPYAYTRNPLYLGSMLMAAGFAVALMNWPVALLMAAGFAAIYVPVMASEERYLRARFRGFDEYCRKVPRFIPRCTAARFPDKTDSASGADKTDPAEGSRGQSGGFSFALYLKHREYNAALGAALLYLSLLYLLPVLEDLVHGPG
jgi:protein-S-isoprenylcysteine O-methyltransferase Ste14